MMGDLHRNLAQREISYQNKLASDLGKTRNKLASDLGKTRNFRLE